MRAETLSVGWSRRLLWGGDIWAETTGIPKWHEGSSWGRRAPVRTQMQTLRQDWAWPFWETREKFFQWFYNNFLILASFLCGKKPKLSFLCRSLYLIELDEDFVLLQMDEFSPLSMGVVRSKIWGATGRFVQDGVSGERKAWLLIRPSSSPQGDSYLDFLNAFSQFKSISDPFRK